MVAVAFVAAAPSLVRFYSARIERRIAARTDEVIAALAAAPSAGLDKPRAVHVTAPVEGPAAASTTTNTSPST
jgi:hypothetical protein